MSTMQAHELRAGDTIDLGDGAIGIRYRGIQRPFRTVDVPIGMRRTKQVREPDHEAVPLAVHLGLDNGQDVSLAPDTEVNVTTLSPYRGR